MQEENEKLSANLANFKNQNRLLQAQLEEQEMMNQQAMAALMASHNEELLMIMKRNEETEKVFQTYRDKITQDLSELMRIKSENQTLKSKLKEQKGSSAAVTNEAREEKLVNSVMSLASRLTY